MLEPLLMFGLIVAYIWTLRPVCPVGWVAIPALMLASHLARRESPRRLGFQVKNLGECLSRLVPALLAAAALVVPVSVYLHTFRQIDLTGALLALAAYLPWGLAQQYALNGYFVNRFDAVVSARAASLVAAVLFAAAHAPNPLLMAVTFPLGWCATHYYRRTRNLYALGVAHAVVGLLLFLVVPDTVSHHLRVGPGWFAARSLQSK